MPPANRVGTASATVEAQSFEFATPIAMRPRDTMLAIVATAHTNDGPDFDAEDLEGWEEIASFGAATPAGKVWILRREALEGDPSTVIVPMLDPLAWGRGALLIYRNLPATAAAVASGFNEVAASINFVCPSLVLTRYSDLYLGIALVTTAAVSVAAPAGTTEIHEVLGVDAYALEVFELLREEPGATGTKTATTAAPQSGLAVALALAADPVIGASKAFGFDPVGAIGLPSEGV